MTTGLQQSRRFRASVPAPRGQPPRAAALARKEGLLRKCPLRSRAGRSNVSTCGRQQAYVQGRGGGAFLELHSLRTRGAFTRARERAPTLLPPWEGKTWRADGPGRTRAYRLCREPNSGVCLLWYPRGANQRSPPPESRPRQLLHRGLQWSWPFPTSCSQDGGAELILLMGGEGTVRPLEKDQPPPDPSCASILLTGLPAQVRAMAGTCTPKPRPPPEGRLGWRSRICFRTNGRRRAGGRAVVVSHGARSAA